MALCPLCTKIQEPAPEDLVWEFDHSRAFLGPWQFFPGYCVLVARVHATELFQLERSLRQAFLEEMNQLASAIAQLVQPRKMNYELLGNQIPHLHWHLFARTEGDPNRLKPVWLEVDQAERDPQVKARLELGLWSRSETIRRIRTVLGASNA